MEVEEEQEPIKDGVDVHRLNSRELEKGENKMPVVLVSEKEKIRFLYKGSVFILRRVSSSQKASMRSRATTITRKGEHTDNDQLAEELLEYAVLGWENVVDYSGKNISFVPSLLPALPDDTKISILEHIDESEIAIEIKKGKELGESETTSSSKSSTPA